MKPKTGEGSATGLACHKSCSTLGLYDPAGPMVLEISVANRDIVKRLWQPLKGKL